MSGQVENRKKSKSVQSAKVLTGIKKERLTQKRLKEVLNYDPETGIFIWKKALSFRVSAGDVAGYNRPDGYVCIRINNTSYQCHRLAWMYVYGYFPEGDIDHIDRTRNNNKIENLRESNRSCNIRNSGLRANNTSGIKGVTLNKSTGMWRSRIGSKSKEIRLGHYSNFVDAVEARYRGEQKYGYHSCDSKSSAREYLERLTLIQYWSII
jgi:hypothetical protein